MKRLITSIYILISLSFSLFSREVEGRVHCGGLLLQGVIVSDGTSFTLTKADGTFKLNLEGDYIHIVTPSGFICRTDDAFPPFWQLTEGRRWFDFDLTAMSRNKDFSLLALTAPQVSDADDFAAYKEKILPDLVYQAVSARIKGLTAGVIIGDVTAKSANQIDRFKSSLRAVKIPFYPVASNSWCGPGEYAFFLRDALIVSLGSGDSATRAVYLEKLLRYIGPDTRIFVAVTFPADSALTAALDGRKADIICPGVIPHGTVELAPGVLQHPIGNITLCPPFPAGYKIFSYFGGSLSWNYHSLYGEDDFPVYAVPPGADSVHPNSPVIKAIDFDFAGKAVWSEDGILRGELQKENDCFTAPAGRYSTEVEVTITNRFGKGKTLTVPLGALPDIQARLVFRDKTLATFNKEVLDAVRRGANSLEAELQLSSGGAVMICRDVYPKYNSEPGGYPVRDLVAMVEEFTASEGFSPRRFTFALNSGSGAGEGSTWPDYREFADKALAELLSFNLGDRLVIESFDDRILNYIHQNYPQVELCYLVDTECGLYQDYMSLLNFRPRWIGYQYEMLTDYLLSRACSEGMRVAVWDINTPLFFPSLVEKGVDSIITDAAVPALELIREKYAY